MAHLNFLWHFLNLNWCEWWCLCSTYFQTSTLHKGQLRQLVYYEKTRMLIFIPLLETVGPNWDHCDEFRSCAISRPLMDYSWYHGSWKLALSNNGRIFREGRQPIQDLPKEMCCQPKKGRGNLLFVQFAWKLGKNEKRNWAKGGFAPCDL